MKKIASPFDMPDPFPDRDGFFAQIRAAQTPSSPPALAPLISSSSLAASSSAEPTAAELEEIGEPPSCLDKYGADVKFLKRKDWTPPAIGSANVFATGKVFYQVGGGKFTPLTAADVNTHFDPKFPGFTKVRDPDWRYNCGDYATGHESNSLGDVGAVWTHLNGLRKIVIQGKSTEEIGEIFRALAVGTYVAAYGYHFLKMVVAGDTVTLSQKDGESAVYSATKTRQQAADYMAEHNEANSAGLYY